MYIVNNEITITWVLGPTASPLTAADYDIKFVPTDLSATYTDAAVLSFIAPTALSAGSMTYVFTPLVLGRYRVLLTTGTNLSYTILDEKDFWVFEAASISVACTEVYGNRSLTPKPRVFFTRKVFLDTIYGFGYNGDDLILVSGDDGAGFVGMYSTDTTLGTLTQVVSSLSLPSWFNNVGNQLSEMVYSPTLDIWVLAADLGQSWWSEDLVTFNYITLASGWTQNNSNVAQVWWDPGLELFFMSSANGAPVLYSATGKSWTRQDSVEAWTAVHPTNLRKPKRVRMNGQDVHFFMNWEEYQYKLVDTGGSTGWTNTANNGVIGGTGGTWPMNNVACDGITLVISAFGDIALTTDVSDHPAGWGDNANNNAGFTPIQVGLPASSGNIKMLLYAAAYDRPWIMYNDVHGFYDAATLISGVTPVFTECSVGIWGELQADFNLGLKPRNHQHSNNAAIYGQENDIDSVWGLSGWGVVIQGTTGDDYLVIQRSD